LGAPPLPPGSRMRSPAALGVRPASNAFAADVDPRRPQARGGRIPPGSNVMEIAKFARFADFAKERVRNTVGVFRTAIKARLRKGNN